MSFADAIKAKKKGMPEKKDDGGNPFAKGGEEKPEGKKDAKPSKGGKGGGFKKAVSNAKKKCKGKKC